MLQRVLFEFGEIVQTRVSVLPLISKYRQAGWKYEAQPSFFFASLSGFRNQRMNTFECLNLLLELVHILRENRDVRFICRSYFK